jgi:putative ABC transport system permease protein
VVAASRLARDRLAAVRRVPGVADAGPVGTASAALVLGDEVLKVALIGVEPGRPGEPPVVQGQALSTEQAREAIIDRSTALRSGLAVGDVVTVRATQGTRDEFYDLRVVGIAAGQQYGLQPSVIVPFFTWDRIRPKAEAEVGRESAVANIIAVRLLDPAATQPMRAQILASVDNVAVATIAEAVQAIPGYSAQQSTLNTQGGFTLLIGVLVIGGFFQIQMLQKVPQVGVLKAIGVSSGLVALAAVLQIVTVTVLGVGLGTAGTLLLSLAFPPTIPIVFNGQTTLFAVVALLVIGPLGGLVSVRYAARIEPLKALGLAS